MLPTSGESSFLCASRSVAMKPNGLVSKGVSSLVEAVFEWGWGGCEVPASSGLVLVKWPNPSQVGWQGLWEVDICCNGKRLLVCKYCQERYSASEVNPK